MAETVLGDQRLIVRRVRTFDDEGEVLPGCEHYPFVTKRERTWQRPRPSTNTPSPSSASATSKTKPCVTSTPAGFSPTLPQPEGVRTELA